MKWAWVLAALGAFASSGLTQEIVPGPVDSPGMTCGAAPVVDGGLEGPGEGGFLSGERAFPNFIGYLSNPELAIDPRSLTQLTPIFASTWVTSTGRIPSGNVQVYGAALDVALSERLSFGLNRGGYAAAQFNRNREGWLDLGGFFQFELIRDVPDQFLVTAGMGVEAPSGSSDLFQGSGPAYLAPYLTVGKEFGSYHVLATTGYQFPTGSGTLTTNTYYGTLHLDRCCGWLYPVLEFNWASRSSSVSLDLQHLLGRLSYDPSIESNQVTVAPGVNAVLVPNQLEVGVVYQTPIASEHNFRFNEVLLKMVLRF